MTTLLTATQRDTERTDAPPKPITVISIPENGTGTPAAEVRYLRSEEFSAWDNFVDKSPQGSVFSHTWWLSALGGSIRILGYFKKAQLLAGMPLYFEKRHGIELCTMPKLTQTLGPLLRPADGRHVNAAWQEMEILSAFAKKLVKQSIVFQAFHPSLQNWSPFYWNGFTQTSRATHIINLDSIDNIWAGMGQRTRRGVRQAEKNGIRITTCSPEDVWLAEQKTFGIQHMKVPHTVEFLRRLYDVAKNNNAGECFAAVDSERRIHAACFAVWDHHRFYAIAMGGDPELRGRGSTSLLVWHMLQFASGKAPIFDFTGSMLQPVELFLRSFGTTQVPYMWIMKFPTWLRMYLTMRGKI